jgi:purine-binding chemotaxis protein CheW
VTGAQPPPADRAAALRTAFDSSFAEPHPGAAPPMENLLAIRLGLAPYALRLAEIAGLHSDRKVTPLPSAMPTLLGIAGFRGTILPVYDLARLVGSQPTVHPRFLAVAREARVAFAFDHLDGHERIAIDSIIQKPPGAGQWHHTQGRARLGGLMRPIVHLPSILAALRDELATNFA